MRPRTRHPRTLLAAVAVSGCVGLATLVAGVGSSAAGEPAGPDPAAVTVDQAVDGVEKTYAGVTDFKATFRQEVIRKHLPRPLKKRGTVYFKKPGMMRWDYTQPEKVLYVSDGKVLWSYQPEDRIVYKMNVVGSELYDALKFLFGQGKLREEFSIERLPPADGLVGLTLTPRVPQSNYKQLTLWVVPGTWEIRVTELVDPLDNISRIRFEGSSYDALKPEGFRFEPPSGVRVEDLHRGPPSGPGSKPE